jgi:hypothetical protein
VIVKYGKGSTEYGPGVSIELDGNEVATAIDAYLVAHGIHVDGSRTIITEEYDCATGGAEVYVDPSGFVIDEDGKQWLGRGPEKKAKKPRSSQGTEPAPVASGVNEKPFRPTCEHDAHDMAPCPGCYAIAEARRALK